MKCTNIVEFALVFQSEARASIILGKVSENELPNKLAPLSMASDIEKLRKLAISLESLNLAYCNYGLSDRQEKRRENIIEQIRSICIAYRLSAITQGDPRGAAFGILTPNTKHYNSWGGESSGFRLIFTGK